MDLLIDCFQVQHQSLSHQRSYEGLEERVEVLHQEEGEGTEAYSARVCYHQSRCLDG